MILAVAGMMAVTTSFGSIVDLTTAGSSGSIGAASFLQVPDQSTGTGIIDPFVRIQKNGAEAAYNTSGSLPASTFNQLGGSQYNTDLLLSSVPQVLYNGVLSYQFLLDINQNRGQTDYLLSMNQLQIFTTTTPGQTGGSWDSATGRLNQSGLSGLDLVYDMNPGGGTANRVELNYMLNPGSGAGDMYLYIPVTEFAGKTGDYVLFYSQFGNPPGPNGSNDGFEEWATITGEPPVVPEPATVLAGFLLLLPFGASALRIVRKNRN